MPSGYIYVLQNKSYGRFVVKIGLTTREPDVRAKELYVGSTGVPEHFDVGFACLVEDCEAAEKAIHSRLRAYRINGRREFFLISPAVARRVVLDSCETINREHGIASHAPLIIDNISKASDDLTVSNRTREIATSAMASASPVPAQEIAIADLTESPVGTTTLDSSLMDRLSIIGMIFDEVFPMGCDELHQTFSRDLNPEHEIAIWEHMAKAFLKVDQVEYLGQREKKEAFALLLMRSMMQPHKAIKKTKPKFFSDKAARRIMAGYELPPMPIVVA